MEQHRRLFADGFDVASFDALAANPAIRILFGRPVALHDPGGFTVWRTGTALAVLVSVWAMLTVVRVTRGDEAAGRWDLLLAGRYRLARLVGMHAGVVAAVTVAVGAAVAGAISWPGPTRTVRLSTARRWQGSASAPPRGVPWSAAECGPPAGGHHWGGRDRRRFPGADGRRRGRRAGVVALVDPVRAAGRAEPFAADRLVPLGVLTVDAAILAVGGALACRRRDLRAGLIPARDSHRARPVLLRSLARFAVRRGLGPVLAWGTGVWLSFLVIGLLASSVTVFLAENRVFADLAARAGFGSLSTVAGYVAFLLRRWPSRSACTPPAGSRPPARMRREAGGRRCSRRR